MSNNLHRNTHFDSDMEAADSFQSTSLTDDPVLISAANKVFDFRHMIGKIIYLNLILEAIKKSAANETYKLIIDDSSDNTFATVDGARHEFEISRDAIGEDTGPIMIAPRKGFIRLQVIAGGTAPDWTISAWFAPGR